ncbi:MAG: glycerol kinase GlpK [Acidimicrobiia bacterium]|nr:MAG: glycerol kinase GlpK [Acidimicrobiia bacterium]
MKFVGAIDQGTTSTRFVVVDGAGSIVAMEQREHRQICPRPGWVEHDAGEIWEATRVVIGGALAAAGIGPCDLAAVGITNQRETTVAWSRSSGMPLAPAIVWQDTRTQEMVDSLAASGGVDRFRPRCGLPLATYFSGAKMRWLLDEVPAVRDAAASGDLALGTIDSWLLWNLTGAHVTDVTNASRTMLMGLGSLKWEADLLDAFGVPATALPEILPSVGPFGEGVGVLDGVPIAGVLGDQQAALFGQAAFEAGGAKNTYGTGCFLLLHTGPEAVQSRAGLLTTVASQFPGRPAEYALEGSVAIAGAGVQWLRDNLGLIGAAEDVEALAATVPDNGGVYFVPAFSGLFAPYWRSDARGVVAGLTRHATAGHLARAVLEATAYQTADVIAAMEADSGVRLDTLFVDGGMVGNEMLMQFQADILGVPVVRPVVTETTALGAAYAAGIAVGFFDGLDQVRALWREGRRWEPAMDPSARARLTTGWHRAVEKSFGWVE